MKRVVPAERLHWVDMSDGWAPLSEVLGKPAPKEPFPRANDSQAVEKTALYVRQRTLKVWLAIVTVTMTLCYSGWKYPR